MAVARRVRSSDFSMPAPSMTQAEKQESLFGAIQRGDLEWKRLAYDDYYPLVRGLLVKSLGPHADIDDLVADVFLAFFESARNIRSADGLRSYMVSVAMNTARREIRRRQRRKVFFWEDAESAVDRTAGSDDPRAKAALIQLSRILDDLNPKDRVTFVLRALEGLPLGEVAETLSISYSTAKRHYRRASERVRMRVQRNPLLTDYIREKAGQRDE